ncbi:MAG TPA: hypothetical protein VMV34_02675 [Terriglobia bacterium]|nr:hypothetical protein [Terriglobia bacterium]
MPLNVHKLSASELAERFRICSDVWPEYTFVGHEKRQIGFQLELSGAHENGQEHPAPGCDRCREVYSALVRIAESVLPGENEECTYQLEPYDQGICYTARHGNRPEITLTIRILHRKGFDHAVDASEVRYLNEIQQRLEGLGAGPHNWVRNKAASH